MTWSIESDTSESPTPTARYVVIMSSRPMSVFHAVSGIDPNAPDSQRSTSVGCGSSLYFYVAERPVFLWHIV